MVFYFLWGKSAKRLDKLQTTCNDGPMMKNEITNNEVKELKAKLESQAGDRHGSFDEDITWDIEMLDAFLEYGAGRGRADKAKEIQEKYSS